LLNANRVRLSAPSEELLVSPSTTADAPSVQRPPFYVSFGQLLKQRFPFKVYKVTIDAGMTCPNIDGTVAKGGCTYCDNTSFSPAFREGDPLISRQIESGMKFYKERFKASHFLAYFQTFSNTYAPVDKLKRLYDRALGTPGIVGMSVGTRPDCIDEEKLRLIQGYVDSDPSRLVCIEYGMQTMHEETARAINRGHTHQSTVEAVELTRRIAPDVHMCLHIIVGLPGESHDMIRASAEECARLKPDSVKIHHCYVYDNTVLAGTWRKGDYRALEFDEYVSLAADVLERMPPTTYIQRMTGEITAKGVLAPHWGKSKLQVIAAISDELARRGTHQGSRYSG
ncbi:MAG: TIGR01212 family radical SAM protein, partial [Planctomycetes bacterium]|nr:TIGR01212 family radical SAM protein [Planctomycetota bacterium]